MNKENIVQKEKKLTSAPTAFENVSEQIGPKYPIYLLRGGTNYKIGQQIKGMLFDFELYDPLPKAYRRLFAGVPEEISRKLIQSGASIRDYVFSQVLQHISEGEDPWFGERNRWTVKMTQSPNERY